MTRTPAAPSAGWLTCASAAARQTQSPSRWRECFNGFFTKKLITTLDSGSGIVMMLAGALPRVADHFLTTRKIDMTINKALLRSEEHTSELQSLMRISYAVFCLKKKKQKQNNNQ